MWPAFPLLRFFTHSLTRSYPPASSFPLPPVFPAFLTPSLLPCRPHTHIHIQCSGPLQPRSWLPQPGCSASLSAPPRPHSRPALGTLLLRRPQLDSSPSRPRPFLRLPLLSTTTAPPQQRQQHRLATLEFSSLVCVHSKAVSVAFPSLVFLGEETNEADWVPRQFTRHLFDHLLRKKRRPLGAFFELSALCSSTPQFFFFF